MGSESPGNDLNPDLREKNPQLGTNVCVYLCEKVCLSHKCTSSFPGSDFSQDKAPRLLPPSLSLTHPLFKWL